MEYANCAKCKKMFLRISNPVCEDCAKEDEELFEKVKRYLNENPFNSIAMVAEATGVSVKKIMKYLREGRLELSQGMATEGFLKCDRCGRPISGGSLCNNCQVQYGKSVMQMMQENAQKKASGGMHSLPRSIDEKKK